jgi:hypothetical protein
VIAIGNAAGNVTVAFGALSYAGTLRITVVSDPSRVPDVAVLVAEGAVAAEEATGNGPASPARPAFRRDSPPEPVQARERKIRLRPNSPAPAWRWQPDRCWRAPGRTPGPIAAASNRHRDHDRAWRSMPTAGLAAAEWWMMSAITPVHSV